MAQKIVHGSSAKHVLSKFDRGADLGLERLRCGFDKNYGRL